MRAANVCDDPPTPTCVDDSTLLSYMSAGTCSMGTCHYASVNITCPHGCADGRCQTSEGTWTELSEPRFPQTQSLRSEHTAVWTGTECDRGVCRCPAGGSCEMIVWGGWNAGAPYQDGVRYRPATDTWVLFSPFTTTPAARISHSAVWTGREMIVWGGDARTPFLGDGSRYDPDTNIWTPISTIGAPSPRSNHSAVWTGSEMIVWSGARFGTYVEDGGRYDPVLDSWAPLSTVGAPLPYAGHSAVWTGTEMIVMSARGGGRWHP